MKVDEYPEVSVLLFVMRNIGITNALEASYLGNKKLNIKCFILHNT